MSMQLAKRVLGISPSATLAMAALAKSMKAEGRPVIDLGLGEPDYPSPPFAAEAGIAAIREGYTRYTPPGGSEELKAAIIERIKMDAGLSYHPKEILVSCGAKHVLYHLAQVLFEEGDEVIVPAPYWVSYPDQIRLNGATPVIVPTREADGFLLQPNVLRAAITPRTKAVIINDPANPTGAAYERSDLLALAEVLTEASLWVISDEIYEKFLYDGGAHVSLATLSETLKQKTIVVNGVSKSHAMTGWRIGYAAGPEEIIRAMETVQSQSTSNPASISQRAATAALRGGTAWTQAMVSEFEKRRDFVVSEINRIPGLHCAKPAGSFYVFPNVTGLMGSKSQVQSAHDLSMYLLKEAGVVTVPGEPFGAPGYIRISYAATMETLIEGVARIRTAVFNLST